MVSSSDGRMPSGTPCGQSEKAFCVMGKCLEFGPDQTPLQYEISGETLTNIENVMKKPRSLLRHLLKKRSPMMPMLEPGSYGSVPGYLGSTGA